MNSTKLRVFVRSAALLSLIAAIPLAAFGRSYGPRPRVSGAPGDEPLTCTQCHAGTLNNGQGSVAVRLPGANVYIPGVTQRIIVELAHPDQARWGFQLTARPASDLSNGQAGTFTPIDVNTQVICEDAGVRPCVRGPMFVSHTAIGTRAGQRGGASFQFDWTPPATDIGNITFYVAGNAANNNGNNAGDFIYTTSVTLTPAPHRAPTATSVVASATGVVGPVTANTWMTAYGTNLSSTTRSWNDGDFMANQMPYGLDGVSAILIQGGLPRLATISYVSPTQVNFLIPAGINTANPLTLQIRNTAGLSAEMPIAIAPNAPQLFSSGGRALVTRANGTTASASNPVNPGETITLWGTGVGATAPAQLPFILAPPNSNLATMPTVVMGGIRATVASAVAAAGQGGVYQLRVTVPADAVIGDQLVVVTQGNVESAGVLLTVAR